MPLNYNPMENAYKTDPTQTHRGTCITFFGTWMELCAGMIEAAHHLHERLGVEEGDSEACNRLLSAVTNLPADLAEQTELGTRFTISGGEVAELGPQEGSEQIPF